MSLLRRGPSLSGRLPLRQAWHNLSAYTSTEADTTAWRDLRMRDATVESLVTRHESKTPPQIDWPTWEQSIRHKTLVTCMKDFYAYQMNLIDEVISEDHKGKVEAQVKGWDLFDAATQSCKKSVENSETLIANGARALWVSYHNPPVWKIDTNEWMDSDQYWQAYVEKHHLYHPTQTLNDPELPAEREAVAASWHLRMGKLNDRSDTPILYNYMDQLPSWEYYDIHRRAFLEHMSYYLIRTGGDYRFFPECPPWQWLTHIEDLRHRFISVTQRRRAAFQLENVERERALDLQPLDYEHHGEEFHLKLLQSEASLTEFLVARLMGNFMFLSHPYIPVQTRSAMLRAEALDSDRGTLFSFGDDLNALFYKPEIADTLPTPRDAFDALMDHIVMNYRRMNPGYASLLEMHADVLEERGKFWFSAPGESVAEAFMRRLQTDDPAFHIYEKYVAELQLRQSNAKEVPKSARHSVISNVERRHKVECALYHQLTFGMNAHVSSEGRKGVDRLTQLYDAQELQRLLHDGLIVCVDESSGEIVTNAEKLIQDLASFEEQKDLLVTELKSMKLGELEKA